MQLGCRAFAVRTTTINIKIELVKACRRYKPLCLTYNEFQLDMHLSKSLPLENVETILTMGVSRHARQIIS